MSWADGLSLEERFRQGDDNALLEMYQRFAGPMYVTALNQLGDREQAADTVQRAFIQAWRARDTFDTERALKPWLYAIIRRAAVDTYRRERRTASEVSLDRIEDLSTDGPSMDRIWRSWQVREALEQLSPEERDVLRLAYYENLSQSEIATQLGLALGTVKSRTLRAQRRLARLLPHLRESSQSVPSFA
ncbi:RNA polymerase sigma factor [Kribbella sp. CA-294648]|uniref:RNA polymerase sigma factor n=1 Tax=Kribbella sp. CA-294648 TaxID=3239948 RepID=UPI003D89E032